MATKYSSQATNFFKFVVNPRDHKLRIPSEFTRRHGRYLPDYVSLKAPNGSVREVRLLRSNGETWLHKGWQEFKNYYSIGFGHLLVFTYDGNSHFDILIYGVNGMEIEYPCNNTNGDKGIHLNRENARVPVKIESKSESDDSVVCLKEISTAKKRKGGRRSVEMVDPGHKGNGDFVEILEDSSARQQRKKKRANDNSLCDPNTLNVLSDDCPAQNPSRWISKFSSRAKQSSRTNETVHSCRTKSVGASRMKLEECSGGTGKQSEKRVQRTVCKETCIAYQKAKSCNFHDPFFIYLMQPSYVSYNFTLSVRFASKFLSQKHNELKLCNSKGKTWFVTCHIGRQSSQLTSGWKKFVLDNSLKVSDACVFEVNKSNPLVWKVTIFRS